MRTLNNHLSRLFWSWIQGKSFYKLSLIEKLDKRDVRDICERRISETFKTPMLQRREYQQFRKFVRVAFPTLEAYQKFYEFNKRK